LYGRASGLAGSENSSTQLAPKGAMIRAVCQLMFSQPNTPIASAAPTPAHNGPYHFVITFPSWFV
jgi:hypothetical protein